MRSMSQVIPPVAAQRHATTAVSRHATTAVSRPRDAGDERCHSSIRLLREMHREVPGEYCYVLEPQAKLHASPAAVASPAPDDSMAVLGTVVGARYRLERVLQKGSMGVLFEAHDLRLDVRVAMKFVRADLASPQATGRLLAEARAAARVSHPSAVRVLDVGVSEHGAPFLVMELLRGISLYDALAARCCPAPEEALGLLLPIVGAIRAAHAEDIIHRDVKPHNIVLATSKDGAVLPKLVDFGIARRMAEPDGSRITQAGTLLGSPEYMAPEQTLGHDADARADVWALCIVLHELLTRTTPFRRGTVLATLEAIQSEDLRPTGVLCREPELWKILTWGLEKDLSRRCSSARELEEALAAWAIGRGNGAGTESAATRWLGRQPAPQQLTSHPWVSSASAAERRGAQLRRTGHCLPWRQQGGRGDDHEGGAR